MTDEDRKREWETADLWRRYLLLPPAARAIVAAQIAALEAEPDD